MWRVVLVASLALPLSTVPAWAGDQDFNAPARTCKWDMKVKYNDGDTAEWRNLNLCKISTISLFWDRKAGATRAVTE